MQDMRNDGFALKQNALGRVLNKDDANQVIGKFEDYSI